MEEPGVAITVDDLKQVIVELSQENVNLRASKAAFQRVVREMLAAAAAGESEETTETD